MFSKIVRTAINPVVDYGLPLGFLRENFDSSMVQWQFHPQRREILLRNLLRQYKNKKFCDHLPGSLPLVSWEEHIALIRR